MYPAASVIIFTTLSGLGFGLLAWLGIGVPNLTGMSAFILYAIGFGLCVSGLLASTFHLRHPERAWRAFSQWRSSWLSREGVAAVVALLVMGLHALLVIFFDIHITVLGWLGAVLCLVTVYATSMIYAQLKTVPRWKTALTPALLLAISVAGGALLAGQIIPAIIFIPVAGGIQLMWWIHGDSAFNNSGHTIGTATGLGTCGEVRAFEPPHTGTNYLLHEFVFQIGRKHVYKLRLMALILGFVLPFVLFLIPFTPVFAVIAILLHLAGIAISRWLFFAEAEHVVGLYYGKR